VVIKEAIGKLVEGSSLSEGEAAAVMGEIMTGEATPAQFGAFVTALRLKGETVDEITGMARVMREKALRVSVAGPLLDTCGTGGDHQGTFNVSTAAAFVCAGAGLRVAKHGNRAMTSACGSADVLEALGARIDLTPEQVAECLERAGIGFMFAPAFHPAMKFAAGPRREIGVRTVFNILGPLTNPAGATAQVLGVAEPSLADKMAQVLGRLGCDHALVVHGEDGFDEISISAATQVWELTGGDVRRYKVEPSEMGLTPAEAHDVRGGSPEENAAALRRVLSGEKGARRDFTLMNAAAGIVAGGKTATMAEGVTLAAKSIDSGAAREALERFVSASNSLD
jgi:anthranilate phosphoribosyltransferase